MKYMTKEWYETMQKTGLHLLLRVTKSAEVYSEDYFRRLYNTEEKAMLELWERVSNVTFEDTFPSEFKMEYLNGDALGPEELEEKKKKYFELREQKRSKFVNNSVFDPEQEKINFRKALLHNVKYLKETLPDEILQNVADIRVLALHCASAKVKKSIKEFCKASYKIVELASESCWKEYKKSFKKCEPDFVKDFNLHDCHVNSCRRKGNDLVLTLDDSYGFIKINQIIFKNCTVIKLDKQLHGAWWLYDEIYKTNDGYEIHVLLQKRGLIDFIVSVTDVEYK